MRDNDNLTDEQAILLSTRDVTAHRTKSAACISCHALINPTGNMFEAFDSLARFRSKESIFTSGGALSRIVELNTRDVVPLWTGSQVAANNYSDFVDQIVNTSSVKACFSRKVVSFANTIKHLSVKDTCKVRKVYDELAKADGTIFSAIVSSVANPSVKFRRVEP